MMAGFEYLPKNADQAYALRYYTGLDLINVWQDILNNIPAHQIFTKTILEAIGRDKPNTKSVERRITIPLKAYNFLREVADSWNTTNSQVIYEMIRFIIYLYQITKYLLHIKHLQ